MSITAREVEGISGEVEAAKAEVRTIRARVEGGSPSPAQLEQFADRLDALLTRFDAIELRLRGALGKDCFPTARED